MHNFQKILKILILISLIFVCVVIFGTIKYEHDLTEYHNKLSCSNLNGTYKFDQFGNKKCVLPSGEIR